MNRAKADELYDKQFDEMLSFEDILTALDKAEARGRGEGVRISALTIEGWARLVTADRTADKLREDMFFWAEELRKSSVEGN